MANDQDDFMGGGFKTFPFDAVGDRVSGVVIELPVKEQQRDMQTNELAFWDDGQPKWMYRIQIQTELRDENDQFDDGIRTLYLSWKRHDAVRSAIRAAGCRNIEIGGMLALQFLEFGAVTKKGFSPPKIGWKAWYKPPVQAAEPAFMGDDRGDAAPASAPRPPQASPTPTYDPEKASNTLDALKALNAQQIAQVGAGEPFPASVVRPPAHHDTEDIPF